MSFKQKMVNAKKAVASTATNTALKTKTAINNAQLGEKTKNAMANLKDKTVDAKNAVVEKSKDMKQTASQKYQNLTQKDENVEISPPMSTRKVAVPASMYSPDGANDIANSKVFGVSLTVACQRSVVQYHQNLPDIVFKCFAYLLDKGVKEEGIFRLSGSTSAIQNMKNSFDRGTNVNLDGCLDPHAIAGLLKLYLRELPAPITPKDVCSGSEKMNHLAAKIKELPPPDRCLLANLMRLLQKITQAESHTKMPVRNLVIVFVPTLHCSSDLVHMMIENAHVLFPTEEIISYQALLRANSASSGSCSSIDDTELDHSYVE